jgi:hypothetical protein
MFFEGIRWHFMSNIKTHEHAVYYSCVIEANMNLRLPEPTYDDYDYQSVRIEAESFRASQ